MLDPQLDAPAHEPTRPAPRRSRRCGAGRRCSRWRWSGSSCPPSRRPAAGVEQEVLEPLEERPGRRLARARSPAPAGSRPVSGRRRSSQYGLGRKRQSSTMSTSSGQAVLVAERHDRGLHAGRRRVLGEQLGQPGLQLVDVEVGGVDHEVGLGLDRLEQRALALDGLEQPTCRRPAGGGGGCCRSAGRARACWPRGTAMRTRWPPVRRLGDGVEDVGLLRAVPDDQGQPVDGARPARWPARRSSRTSEVGRLSTTYQPRSSRTAAALERPAPDRPGDHHDVGHPRPASRATPSRRRSEGPVRRRLARLRRSEQRGGCVAAPAYSRRRARKPAGGAGSSIRSMQQAVGGQRVHVAAERAVDEGDEHVLLDLLDRLVLDEVGPDPPVLLGRVEDLVVDPAAVRRLQQRVVEEEAGSGRRARSTRATSAMAASTSRMCSNTRQATTASKQPSGNGSASAPARA